jgi:hypothetical protein
MSIANRVGSKSLLAWCRQLQGRFAEADQLSALSLSEGRQPNPAGEQLLPIFWVETSLRWAQALMARGRNDDAAALAADAWMALENPKAGNPVAILIRRLQAGALLARALMGGDPETLTPEKARQALRAGAWLDTAWPQIAYFNHGFDAVEAWPTTWIATDAALAQAALALNPPRPGVARRLAARGIALGKITGASTKEVEAVAIQAGLTLEDVAAALPDPPSGLWTESGVARSEDLLAYLHRIAPPIDWAAEFPDLLYNPETFSEALPPDYQATVERLIRESLALGKEEAPALEEEPEPFAPAAAPESAEQANPETPEPLLMTP